MARMAEKKNLTSFTRRCCLCRQKPTLLTWHATFTSKTHFPCSHLALKKWGSSNGWGLQSQGEFQDWLSSSCLAPLFEPFYTTVATYQKLIFVHVYNGSKRLAKGEIALVFFSDKQKKARRLRRQIIEIPKECSKIRVLLIVICSMVFLQVYWNSLLKIQIFMDRNSRTPPESLD